MKSVVRGVLVAGAGLALAGSLSVSSAQQPSAASPTRVAFVNARALLTGMPGYAQAESTFTA